MSDLHVCSINLSEYIPLNDDIKLIMMEVGKHSILQRKLTSLLWALKYAPTEGVLADFGAYKGGCGLLFTKMRPDQEVLLFDTWTGLPNCLHKQLDTKKPGDWNDAPLKDVEKLFQDNPKVHLIPGEFKDTMPQWSTSRFSLAFVDADIYHSTSEVLKFVKPRMVPGGIIVIDDYNQIDCQGVKKAVSEEFPITELVLLQHGSLVAWQNLSPAE